MRNVQWLRNCILFCRWNWKCRCFCGLAAVPAYWSAYQLRRISICPVVRRHTYGPNSMPAPLSQIPPRPLLSLTNCTQPDFVPFVISCHIMFIEKRAPGGSVLTQYVAGDWDSIPGKGRNLSFSAASRSVLSPSLFSDGYRGLSASFVFMACCWMNRWTTVLMLKCSDRKGRSLFY